MNTDLEKIRKRKRTGTKETERAAGEVEAEPEAWCYQSRATNVSGRKE